MTDWANILLTIFCFIITVLLSIIGFFLIRHLNEMTKIAEKVDELNVQQAKQDEKITNISDRVNKIEEMLRHSLYP